MAAKQLATGRMTEQRWNKNCLFNLNIFMSGESFDKLNLGVREKYEAAFSAIHSGSILSATEKELADHARALASYHFEYVGQDQLAAALLIHGLQFSLASAKIDRKTGTLSVGAVRRFVRAAGSTLQLRRCWCWCIE